MKSSLSPSESAAAAKPPPYCAFPGCKVHPTKTCARCKETQYCSREYQTEHWRWHKKICVALEKKKSAPVPPAPPIPVKGKEEEDEGTCIICLDNVANAEVETVWTLGIVLEVEGSL
ncbi:hypothetical protein TrLO_g15097 [Triparma laevis f. longispina]|uniref:MYND-type domain-containing protein n=1 Tax=Triparma laevis f. longispina TaxID=1714387 RepID=A0A9W7E4Z6_9STRA|nr:hypothetical protein TrLO_g15097 [Triparma laevis f. longispina]